MATLESELRVARNGALDQKGSIHDDATASKLGFRGAPGPVTRGGGTPADPAAWNLGARGGAGGGGVHMARSPPLLLRIFGPRFFETGGLSLYFQNATVDREPVRAYAEEPAGGATQIG